MGTRYAIVDEVIVTASKGLFATKKEALNELIGLLMRDLSEIEERLPERTEDLEEAKDDYSSAKEDVGYKKDELVEQIERSTKAGFRLEDDDDVVCLREELDEAKYVLEERKAAVELAQEDLRVEQVEQVGVLDKLLPALTEYCAICRVELEGVTTED